MCCYYEISNTLELLQFASLFFLNNMHNEPTFAYSIANVN